MRSKSNKVYSLAQVAKLLHRSKSTVYNYVIVGLIKVSSDARVGRAGRTVTEAEYQRLKRDGVDPTGVKDELAKYSSTGKSAKKKQVKRSASASAAKKRVKRKAAATVAKKQTRRSAVAASGKAVKKQTRRGATAKTAKKGKR